MKKIYALCNAHLDPVWLWQKEEGAAEAISTFRVAADFCEQYDGFVFNHNESLLYEWVETYEPVLFRRIQALVSQGKWRIMGGWYLQPDCTMPSGESFIRQIEAGSAYFREKFGVTPKTAVNFDPFGHTRGLVQILKKYGYENYLFMRPGHAAPDCDFIWRGYDGSELLAHRIQWGYASGRGKITEKINHFIEEEQQTTLMCWGIGNHGGGPSREDWLALRAYQAAHPEIEIIPSGCEEYFAAVDRASLKTHEKSLVHCMVGCYTSMALVKQKHRALENSLIRYEKMLAASGVPFDETALRAAEKDLLFSEFHDSLPGTMIRPAEAEILRQLDHGLEITSRAELASFFRLCEGQPKAKTGEIPLLVFNPNPYRVTQTVEAEFQLADQNWTEQEITTVCVRAADGSHLPAQLIKEDSMIRLDWRKRIAFTAELAPMAVTRFDCELKKEALPSRPIAPFAQSETAILFSNDSMRVSVSKTTGLLENFAVNEKTYIESNGAQICVFDDNEDPWRMDTDGFYTQLGAFRLLSDAEANAFNGVPAETLPNVRVIENGSVFTRVQAIFRYDRSYAVVNYTFPKQGCCIDIHVTLYSNNANRMYKLAFPTTLRGPRFFGQTAFGTEELEQAGKEVGFQKWCGLFSDGGNLAVLNNGTYGGSCDGGTMYLSLLRTPVYSAHPISERPLTEHDRNHNRIDMGMREFSFRLTAETDHIDADAEQYNQPVFALSFFPSGEGEAPRFACELENRALVLTRLCRENGGYLLRIFNPAPQAQQSVLRLNGTAHTVTLPPFTFETFRFPE